MKRLSSSRSGLDLVADLLKAADQAVGGLDSVCAVEVDSAEVVPFGAGAAACARPCREFYANALQELSETIRERGVR